MPEKKIEVLFSPAEYQSLRERDLSKTACVVFDVLRATTTMVTALWNGASEIFPVAEIDEALALRAKDPEILLAGERDGLRIRAYQTGGVDFDLGNSPREFTSEKVRYRKIAITTTNGTRAIRACGDHHPIYLASFHNLFVTACDLISCPSTRILLICAGTGEEAALEDILGAGALIAELQGVDPTRATFQLADSAQIALAAFDRHKSDIPGAVAQSRNGRRLLAIPELAPDVSLCLQRNANSAIVGQFQGSFVRIGCGGGGD